MPPARMDLTMTESPLGNVLMLVARVTAPRGPEVRKANMARNCRRGKNFTYVRHDEVLRSPQVRLPAGPVA